jgi:hypothetical protein
MRREYLILRPKNNDHTGELGEMDEIDNHCDLGILEFFHGYTDRQGLLSVLSGGLT